MRRRGREGQARENKHVGGRRSSPARGAAKLDEEDLLDIVRSKDAPFLLVLDCVQDPHNLGAILRTADGAGVDAVVLPKDKSAGITETVRRISVGAADHIPLAQVT
ncbi:MAG: TrmH family RNA methyltransferase, partial [Akkermansiaceae bacterium]